MARWSRSARTSGGDILTALASVIGLTVVIAGVPAALWMAVGWPLPHALPSLSALRAGLERATIPDELFPKTLATVAWLAWVQFLACIAVEASAALRGRRPLRVPGAGWGVQTLAAKLVGAALLLLPAPAMASPLSVGMPSRPPAVVRMVEPQPSGGEPAAAPRLVSAAPAVERTLAEQAHPRYLVQRRDTLWRLAERHLGDPLRWHDIFSLNKGREQPDGRRLEEPHWIYPGWELLMPADATGLPAPPSGAGQERPSQQEPSPSEQAGQQQPPSTTQPKKQPSRQQQPGHHHQPRPAPSSNGQTGGRPTTTGHAPTTAGRQEAQPGAVWPPVPGANVPTTSTPEKPPSTKRPATTQPKPGEQAGRAPARSGPATTTRPSASAGASERGVAPEQHSSAGRALPFVGGFLAAGILAVLAVRRRMQQRRRATGETIPRPEPESAQAELVLRDRERPEDAEFIDVALRALAAALHRDGLDAPPVLGVLIGDEYLEVLLGSETDVAPMPFLLGDTGHRWGLPLATPATELEELAGDMGTLLPGLVTLGEGEDGLLLVNLEGIGLIALAGEQDSTEAMLAAMAVELGTSPWADYLELVLVGIGDELDGLEGVTSANSLEEALPSLEHRAGEISRVLDLTGRASVLDARIAGIAAGSWTTTVLLCAPPVSAAAIQRVTSLTSDPERSTVAVVVCGEVPGADWSLEVGPDHVHVTPLGIDVRPQRLKPDEFASVAGLLHDAGDTGQEPGPPGDDEHDGDGEIPLPRILASEHAPAVNAGPAPEVDVRVLGEIEIAGVDRIDRGKSEELIVYLALHPQGVDADQLTEALWPGRPPARGTFNTTVAVARTALGGGEDGSPRLPHAHNGVYRLDPSIGLDWTRFQALAARGFAAGEDGAEDLRDALELVRGRPFEGARPRTYGWAELDEAPAMASTIVDVADRLADLCLREGDHSGAAWAARRGLATAPYDERLYRRLMLAADQAGNPAGVEAVMDELLRRLDDDELEPYDSLHTTTRELYERLRRQSPSQRPSS
jgi:DNA-binding SARP family transcriptional activator